MNRRGFYATEQILLSFKERTSNSISRFNESELNRGLNSFKRKARDKLTAIRPSEMVMAINEGRGGEELTNDHFRHLTRRKTKWELILLSGAVCGIEFCYAAETAFVTPILLGLGISIKYMSLIWCLSPLFGLFLGPILGSLSDSCRLKLGRRRPFILLLSAGILFGLIFVPNGKDIGLAIGDYDYTFDSGQIPDENVTFEKEPTTTSSELNSTDFSDLSSTPFSLQSSKHSWGITFTVIGTVLLDLCSDACQSPARTYLLDVTVPADHVLGLSVFTVMAGFGGAVGYAMGGVNWESTLFGTVLGSHERVVFTIVTVLFIICLSMTVTSFKEMPLDLIGKFEEATPSGGEGIKLGKYRKFSNESTTPSEERYDTERRKSSYGTLGDAVAVASTSVVPRDNDGVVGIGEKEITITKEIEQSSFVSIEKELRKSLDLIEKREEEEDEKPSSSKRTTTKPTSFKEYFKSILNIPKSLRILCLTNLFCWMSLVSYSLFFTDFVGECVFEGDPRADQNDPAYIRYREGVRFGCWGMSFYSISCSAYSYSIEKIVKRFGAKRVFVGGQLVYTIGMLIMAITRHKISVILLSPTAGIMYATLFTMPYLLVAHYHATDMFARDVRREEVVEKSQPIRGIGTDVALVGCMVFLSQFLLSSCMGSIVSAVGSSVATVYAAVFLSACGAISATRVVYLDL